jgi:tetratricopeptide (TPR) repeat protein
MSTGIGIHRWSLAFFAAAVVALGCAPAVQEEPQAPEAAKIPISTGSDEALELFLEGRTLADNLRGAEAREFFLQAVEKDADFALAHLALANSATSAQEFFSGLERAVELAGGVSEGERLWILGQDEGSRGNPDNQRENYRALVEMFPEDERAHNLLAGHYFGRQSYEPAIEHYRHAIEINPEYSQPYNQMGYAYRALGRFDEAEEAFKRYIELIPEEPNPYDSYAELLMKAGRFEESIANYEKALEKNPQFVFSYVGIGNNQIFQGQPEEARATFQRLFDAARNDGERRTAHFWTAASHVYEGNPQAALAECEKMSAIAEENGDLASVSGDLGLMGNIHLHAGSPDEAEDAFQRATEIMEEADVNEDVKEGARRNLLYFEARVALHRGDLETAKAKTETYATAAEAKGIPFEIRRVHYLRGAIALDEGDHEGAVTQLESASQQDPRVLYLMAQACQGAGDLERARDLAERAARFNQLTMNFAYVKEKAEQLLTEL